MANENEYKDYAVYDGKGQILGRLASSVAKTLLSGKNVAIVNAEQLIISGDAKTITSNYKTRVDLKDSANPEHSPYWPRRPDMLVKRIIRGMLPYNSSRGRDAFKRLRVFVGVPEVLKGNKPIEIKSKSIKTLYTKHTSIAELSKSLGYDKFTQ